MEPLKKTGLLFILLALSISFVAVGSTLAEGASASESLFGVSLHEPVERFLSSSPALATGADEELCVRYGYCVYAAPDPENINLDSLTVTAFDGAIIKMDATADIGRLRNPLCDAYDALVHKYGQPVSEHITQAIRASKRVNLTGRGRGVVETEYPLERFRDECARCALEYGAQTMFLVDLRFSGNLRTVVTPGEISYTLGDEAEALGALDQALRRRDAACDEDCRRRREAAPDSLNMIGAPNAAKAPKKK